MPSGRFVIQYRVYILFNTGGVHNSCQEWRVFIRPSKTSGLQLGSQKPIRTKLTKGNYLETNLNTLTKKK